ncbi:MAG: class I SAM-dependent methyltransferase [Pseudomonadota bacterium]
MSDVKLPVPLKFRRGSLRENEAASVASGVKLVEMVQSIRPVDGASILDFGCGVKLAQALVEMNSPQTLYVGLDVYREMVEFLQDALSHDARYRFVTVNFHNQMYNRDGEDMAFGDTMPIEKRDFDLMTMFSVITHMEPDDTRATLRRLRTHAGTDAHLIFSAFVRDQAQDFIDSDPDRPLLRAFYRREFLDQIIGQSGWSVESFNRPVAGLIQHHYICRPA